MVNPVPAKGANLLHQLIRRMPEQHFTLVEGWWNTVEQFAGYPNVTYVPRVYDMSTLYSGHRLLLVPSTVEDAFPRVIVEAALHGTPSIGTDRGGMPEAMGPTGIVLPAEVGPEEWAGAIRSPNHRGLGKRLGIGRPLSPGHACRTSNASGSTLRRTRPPPDPAGPSTSAATPRPP
ncbi:glycosyltransferase [Streptomyces sp. NPDC048581]|uniref:glycosyltransferase n=1 Tax=unclassified Streptomyces TaxID=2593676 RepID=UPI003717759A